MRWIIQVENEKHDFVDAGLPVWDDGYAKDGSDRGDEESKFISDHLENLRTEDPAHRAYATTWAGE